MESATCVTADSRVKYYLSCLASQVDVLAILPAESRFLLLLTCRLILRLSLFLKHRRIQRVSLPGISTIAVMIVLVYPLL